MAELRQRPLTRPALAEDLRALGLQPGMILMVHAALGQVGWVVGGAPSVIRAILDVLGPEGTLVMPGFSPEVSDPAAWREPTIPAAWLEEARANIPVFDPATTPTSMGLLAETFRSWPGVLRSDHPMSSVCARGPKASAIVADHAWDYGEGAGTPFEALYDRGAWILMLGVGFNRCTALHFAESHLPQRRTRVDRVPVERDGERLWLDLPTMGHDNDTHFPAIGAAYAEQGPLQVGSIGAAHAQLMPMRDLADFATSYLNKALA